MALKLTDRAARNHQPERLHQPSYLVREFDRGPDQFRAGSDQSAGQHAIEAFQADLAVAADLGQLGKSISIIGIGIVRRHVERHLGMAGIDADRRQSLCDQCVIEPYRQGSRLEDHSLSLRRVLADHVGEQLRVGPTLAAPGTLAGAPCRNGVVGQFEICLS